MKLINIFCIMMLLIVGFGCDCGSKCLLEKKKAEIAVEIKKQELKSKYQFLCVRVDADGMYHSVFRCSNSETVCYIGDESLQCEPKK